MASSSRARPLAHVRPRCPSEGCAEGQALYITTRISSCNRHDHGDMVHDPVVLHGFCLKMLVPTFCRRRYPLENPFVVWSPSLAVKTDRPRHHGRQWAFQVQTASYDASRRPGMASSDIKGVATNGLSYSFDFYRTRVLCYSTMVLQSQSTDIIQ